MNYTALMNQELIEIFFTQNELVAKLEAEGENYIYTPNGIESTERYDKALATAQRIYKILESREIDPFNPNDVERVENEAHTVHGHRLSKNDLKAFRKFQDDFRKILPSYQGLSQDEQKQYFDIWLTGYIDGVCRYDACGKIQRLFIHKVI